MEEIMKKALFSIFILLSFTSIVKANTINELYNELNSLKEAKELYSMLTTTNIDDINEKLLSVNDIVDNLYQQINEINNEITKYQEDILAKKKTINGIMLFHQVSNNGNSNVQYIMDSNDYVNLVYRKVAVKQITNYYNDIIDKINDDIKKLTNQKIKLQEQIDKVTKEQEKYKRLELALRASGNKTGSLNTSIDDDINSLQEEIAMYKKMGCNNNENLSFCLNIYNTTPLTYPLEKGCVSKEYNKNTHKGIDLACNKEGKPVYSTGAGVVARIVRKSDCGGNIVFIYHNVLGKEYTTIYAHLLNINVSIGETVNKNTVIGSVGGDSTAVKNGGYDKCTTGAHLHYAITYGHHAYDYNIYLFNPSYLNTYPELLSGYFKR